MACISDNTFLAELQEDEEEYLTSRLSTIIDDYLPNYSDRSILKKELKSWIRDCNRDEKQLEKIIYETVENNDMLFGFRII